MACGGSSGMDACRAGEHALVGTTLLPKPVHRVWRSRRFTVTDMLAVTGERAWTTARHRREHQDHTDAETRRRGAGSGAVAGGAVRHRAVRRAATGGGGAALAACVRSEERSVGDACVSTGNTRGVTNN